MNNNENGLELIDFLTTALDNPIALQLTDARLLPSITESGEPLDPSDAEPLGLPIHRVVLLARAPTLSQQLQLHLHKDASVALPAVSPRGLAALVQHLYLRPLDAEGSGALDPPLAMALFRAARLWRLESLAVCCQEFLRAQLSEALCVPCLLLSHELDAPLLHVACAAFLAPRFDAVRDASRNFAGLSPAQLLPLYAAQLPLPSDLLCFAVAQGRPDVVYHLLSAGEVLPLLNAPDSRGRTPLLLALAHVAQHPGLAATLIDHGADLDAPALLRGLIAARDEPALRYLLARGCRLHAAVDPATGDGPLHLALAHGLSEPLLRQLVAAGPQLELANRQGLTPLAVCVESDNAAGAALLLEHGVGFSPQLLWRALALHRLRVAEQLVQRDPRLVDHIIDVPAGSRNSLLLAAVSVQNFPAVRFLLRHAAPLSHLDAAGNSVFHLLVLAWRPNLFKSQSVSQSQSQQLQNQQNNQQNEQNNQQNDQQLQNDQQQLQNDQQQLQNNQQNDEKEKLQDDDDIVDIMRALCAQAPQSLTSTLQHLNGDGVSPLRLALRRHAFPLAEILIDAGRADVDEVDFEEINSLLHSFVLAAEPHAVLFLLRRGANPKVLNRAGRTPLALAVAQRLSACVTPLVEGGADVHDRDEKGRALLRLALLQHDYETARGLVQCGADANQPEPDLSEAACGYPLLHLAVLERDDATLQFLLDLPRVALDLRAGAARLTPLHLAAGQGYQPGIELLLGRGADPALQDDGGRSALHLAILSQHAEAVRTLIGSLRPEDRPSLEAMFRECIALKDSQIACILQNAGVDIEQVDREGQSLLHRAIEEGQEAAVIFLMNPLLRANVNSVDHHSRTPLHSAVRAGLRGIVNALLASGADATARDSCGRTFLWLAAQLGKDDIMKATIAAWSELDAFVLPDSEGLTPLMAAVKANHTATVLLLLNHHANALSPGQTDSVIYHIDGQKSQSALHYVPRYGAASNLARMLGERYPRLLKMQDHAGNTPLHIACSMGQEETAIELVKLGASLCVPNLNGITALRTKPLSSTESEWQIFQRGLLEYIPREPEWLPDEVCQICQQCSREFGFARRRHHCRYCGQVVCADCSPKPFPIFRFNIDSPVRLCRLCYNLLSNPRSSSSHA